MMQIKYPYQIDSRGRTAEATDGSHVQDLVEQVLFTAPGERVNRPTFGTGLMQLVFEPNSQDLASAVQLAAQSALQLWLGDVLAAEYVNVQQTDSELVVTVTYTIRQTLERKTAVISRPLA
jgi:phage baseplate assembly protein W